MKPQNLDPRPSSRPHPDLRAGAAGVFCLDPASLDGGPAGPGAVFVAIERELHQNLDGREGHEVRVRRLPVEEAAVRLAWSAPGDPKYRLASDEEVAEAVAVDEQRAQNMGRPAW